MTEASAFPTFSGGPYGTWAPRGCRTSPTGDDLGFRLCCSLWMNLNGMMRKFSNFCQGCKIGKIWFLKALSIWKHWFRQISKCESELEHTCLRGAWGNGLRSRRGRRRDEEILYNFSGRIQSEFNDLTQGFEWLTGQPVPKLEPVSKP